MKADRCNDKQKRPAPDELAVVGGDEQVVAGGVHGHGADPLRARLQLAHQLLLHQVVHAHHALRLDGTRGLATYML